MKIDVLTIFPDLFDAFFKESLVGKSVARGILNCNATNIRDFADPPHFKVDDTPYGGGPGMIMTPGPLVKSIETAKLSSPGARTVLLSASGHTFTQAKAQELSALPGLILVCGRYEGIDQRAIDLAIDEELSIGDYVLMGGEVAPMVVIEATVRLLPEVLGNAESTAHESFSPSTSGMLEAPQYTRPPDFRGHAVPDILLSGNHQAITSWRSKESTARTARMRPDLLSSQSKRKE